MNKAFEKERESNSRERNDRQRLENVRDLVRNALSEAGVSSSNKNKEETELSEMLTTFFRHAEDTFAKSSQIELPEDKRVVIETYLKDFETRNAEEVIKDLTRVLFPPGRQEQSSAYGIPIYNGGSVESWMEEILFLDSYIKETWPFLSEMQNQWKANRRRASDILKELNEMILKGGVVPAAWLVT